MNIQIGDVVRKRDRGPNDDLWRVVRHQTTDAGDLGWFTLKPFFGGSSTDRSGSKIGDDFEIVEKLTGIRVSPGAMGLRPGDVIWKADRPSTERRHDLYVEDTCLGWVIAAVRWLLPARDVVFLTQTELLDYTVVEPPRDSPKRFESDAFVPYRQPDHGTSPDLGKIASDLFRRIGRFDVGVDVAGDRDRLDAVVYAAGHLPEYRPDLMDRIALACDEKDVVFTIARALFSDDPRVAGHLRLRGEYDPTREDDGAEKTLFRAIELAVTGHAPEAGWWADALAKADKVRVALADLDLRERCRAALAPGLRAADERSVDVEIHVSVPEPADHIDLKLPNS